MDPAVGIPAYGEHGVIRTALRKAIQDGADPGRQRDGLLYPGLGLCPLEANRFLIDIRSLEPRNLAEPHPGVEEEQH